MLIRNGRRSTDSFVRRDPPRDPLTLEELAEHRALDAEYLAGLPARKSESLKDALADLFSDEYFAERLTVTDVVSIAKRIRAAHDDDLDVFALTDLLVDRERARHRGNQGGCPWYTGVREDLGFALDALGGKLTGSILNDVAPTEYALRHVISALSGVVTHLQLSTHDYPKASST